MTKIKFKIDHFPNNTIEVTVCTRYNEVTIYDIKEEIRSCLNLQRDSLWIFGVYQGTLHNSGRIYTNHNDLFSKTTDNHLCFKRRPVQLHEEIILISRDPNALKLLFWELKHHYETQTILPRPTKEMSENLVLQTRFMDLVKSYSELMSNILKIPIKWPRLFVSPHLEIVEKMQSVPLSYLSYFHRVEDCILAKDTNTDPPITKGLNIHIILDTSKLILMNETDNKEILSWPWNRIGKVAAKLVKESKPTFTFKILDSTSSHEVHSVTIVTHKNQYLLYMIHYMKEYYFNNVKIPHYHYSSDDDSLEYYGTSDEEDSEVSNRYIVPLHFQALQNALGIS